MLYGRDMADVTVTREIAATPQRVWEVICDLRNMGDLSPENDGGTWRGDSSTALAGATFKGSNHNGWRKWSTKVVVTEAAADQRLAFDVSVMGIPVSRWSYDIEGASDGCVVTESWTDRRPGWFVPVAKLATGVADRADFNRSSIEQTLENLAATAEAGDATD